MKPRRSSKSQHKFRFVMTVHDVLFPQNIVKKVQSSKFYIVLSRGNKDSCTQACTIDENGQAIFEDACELEATLIKNRKTNEFLTKHFRIILKQIKAPSQHNINLTNLNINTNDNDESGNDNNNSKDEEKKDDNENEKDKNTKLKTKTNTKTKRNDKEKKKAKDEENDEKDSKKKIDKSENDERENESSTPNENNNNHNNNDNENDEYSKHDIIHNDGLGPGVRKTVGSIKRDLVTYATQKQVQQETVQFTKCNLDDVYISFTMEAFELELDNSAGVMDDTMSVASVGTVFIDNVMMDDDFSNELFENRMRNSNSPPLLYNNQQNLSKFRLEHAMANMDDSFSNSPNNNELFDNNNLGISTSANILNNNNNNNNNTIGNSLTPTVPSNNKRNINNNRRFSMPANKLSTISEHTNNNNQHKKHRKTKSKHLGIDMSKTPPDSIYSNIANGHNNSDPRFNSNIHSLSANNSPGMLGGHGHTVNVNLNNLNHMNNVIMSHHHSGHHGSNLTGYADISQSHPLYDELVRARKKIDDLELQLKKKEKLIQTYREQEVNHTNETLEWQRVKHGLQADNIEMKLKLQQEESKNADLRKQIADINLKAARYETQLQKNMQRHGELLESMHKSKSELKRKIAELMEQNDDLEETLLMVRNSWTQTGNVMESQVEKMKKKEQQLLLELTEYKSKYNNLLPEYEEISKKLEKIREEKFHSTEAVSDLELKSAAKLVEITKLRNEIMDHKSQNEKLQYLVLKLLQVCPKNENGDIMFNDESGDINNVLQLNNNELEQHMTANLMNFAIDSNGNTLQNMVDLHDSQNKQKNSVKLANNDSNNSNNEGDLQDSKVNNSNNNNEGNYSDSDSIDHKEYRKHMRARGSLSMDNDFMSGLSSCDNVEEIAKAVDAMQKDFEQTQNGEDNDSENETNEDISEVDID